MRIKSKCCFNERVCRRAPINYSKELQSSPHFPPVEKVFPYLISIYSFMEKLAFHADVKLLFFFGTRFYKSQQYMVAMAEIAGSV